MLPDPRFQSPPARHGAQADQSSLRFSNTLHRSSLPELSSPGPDVPVGAGIELIGARKEAARRTNLSLTVEPMWPAPPVPDAAAIKPLLRGCITSGMTDAKRI